MQPTLFLSPKFSPDSRVLQAAALAKGWNVNRLHRWTAPEFTGGKCCVYGETLFARFIAEHLKLQLLDPPHDWLPALPEEFRKRKVDHMTVSEARKIAHRSFIKPVDDKTFKAQVFDSGSELPSHLEESEFVLVAEPLKWVVEYRFFLLNGKALTGSVYSRNGELDETPGSPGDFEIAQKLAETVAGDLPAGVVVDVGIIDERGWAVVEANPAWGSGIYQCDPEKVLYVVAASCA